MTPEPIDFRLGTAGWSYEDWKGTVYPRPEPPGFSALRFMAGQFDFVEVNTTFYRIPAPGLAEGWLRQVSDCPGFNFWIKLNRSFTHGDGGDAALASAFSLAIAPLREAGKLAGLLAQFPYSFHHGEESLVRIQRLRKKFAGIPLAVEFRHRSWNRDHVLSFLHELNICWTNIDQPRISRSLPLTDNSSRTGVEYLRLHGRNSREWFSGSGRNARYDYDYSTAELKEIADKAASIGKKTSGPVYVSGNNHYKGQAVRNLKTLKEILDAMAPTTGSRVGATVNAKGVRPPAEGES